MSNLPIQVPDFTPALIAGIEVAQLQYYFLLPPGVTLIGTPKITVANAPGSPSDDPSPQSRLGAVSIGTYLKTNDSIVFEMGPGNNNVNYLLSGSCNRSDRGAVAVFNHIFSAPPS